MEPESLVTRHHGLNTAPNAQKNIVLPVGKRLERCGLIHRLGGAILKDIMRPTRVARQDVAERAIVDHLRPRLVLLDDLTRARLRSERSPFTCLRQRGCPMITGSVPGLRESSLVQ